MKIKEKEIVFDMDGTIVDFYGVDNWLEMLNNENPTPYIIAQPLYNMNELIIIINELKAKGFVITVTTWLSMNATNAYKREIRKAKKEWLNNYGFPYDELHMVQYGTPKHYVTKAKRQILVDDSAEVRNAWKGETINATKNIIPALEKLLNE